MVQRTSTASNARAAGRAGKPQRPHVSVWAAWQALIGVAPSVEGTGNGTGPARPEQRVKGLPRPREPLPSEEARHDLRRYSTTRSLRPGYTMIRMCCGVNASHSGSR